MVEKRVMTRKDYEVEQKRILLDDRYPLELKRWSILQLLNIFREINHCLPHQMRDSTIQENDWRW